MVWWRLLVSNTPYMLRAELITIHSMSVSYRCTKWESQHVQSLSHVQLFPTSWTITYQALRSSTISRSLLKFMCVELVMLSNHLILYCPLVLPEVSASESTSESALRIRWPKYWSFSISPSNEYSRLISFRVDWFGLKWSLVPGSAGS